MNGWLLVDKDSDWTSFDVVAKVRSVIKRAGIENVKVGHTGTLDPQATGLLVLAIGRATKHIKQVVETDKVYEAEVTLGYSSTTDDIEGELTEVNNQEVERAIVLETIENFVGEIEQIPPQFSAIKVDGKRAYKQARKGKKVELEPRRVSVFSIEDIEYAWPTVSFKVKVSKGTYIRSIARDLGEQLGVGGYLSKLRRTEVGQYLVQDALRVNELNIESIRANTLPLD